MRRDGVAARGDDGRGQRARQTVEVRLHGNIGQDRPQRQGALPGATAAGKAPEHLTAAGRHQVAIATASRDVASKVRADVTVSDDLRIYFANLSGGNAVILKVVPGTEVVRRHFELLKVRDRHQSFRYRSQSIMLFADRSD